MKLLVAGLSVCLFILIGCGGPNPVGTWSGDLPPAQDPSSESGQKAEAFRSMMGSPSLEIRSDKTFKLTLFGSMEGTWTMFGDTIELTVKPPAGMSAKMEPMKLHMSSDGKALAFVTEGDKTGGITFHRK